MKLKRRVDPQNCTLVEYAYARTGSILKAGRCLSYLTLYAAARESLGHDPTTEEYAEWAGESRATAFRHAALWRSVFDKPPGVVLDAIEAQQRGVQERVDLSGLALAS